MKSTNELNDIIRDVSIYGLTPRVEQHNKLANLERSLIALYAFILNTPEAPDESAYLEAPKASIALRENIAANFPSFGYYKDPLDILDVYKMDDMGIADAVDDLHDIIYTLLEVQWRMNHTSYTDAVYHLKLAFRTHLKQHVLGLLTYMGQLL